MSNKVFIANTNVELEFEQPCQRSLIESLEAYPICLQLQFLPLLFAEEKDLVVVTSLPQEEYLKSLKEQGFKLPLLATLDQKITGNQEVISWGWSKSVAIWAKENQLQYQMPDWEVVRTVNSKAWSFENSPRLVGAEALYDKQALLAWISKQGGDSVLKTCFGLSGRGHCFLKKLSEVTKKELAFCEKEWSVNRPILAEPWVYRVLDFSSQWLIDQTGKVNLVGLTKMLNNSYGVYVGTVVGSSSKIFEGFEIYVDEHLEWARKILRKIQMQGYAGYVGIDAMVYEEDKTKSLRLQPIVEVNARMTMALVALLVQQKRFAQKVLKLSYEKRHGGLLPKFLVNTKDKEIKFNKQLSLQLIE